MQLHRTIQPAVSQFARFIFRFFGAVFAFLDCRPHHISRRWLVFAVFFHLYRNLLRCAVEHGIFTIALFQFPAHNFRLIFGNGDIGAFLQGLLGKLVLIPAFMLYINAGIINFPLQLTDLPLQAADIACHILTLVFFDIFFQGVFFVVKVVELIIRGHALFPEFLCLSLQLFPFFVRKTAIFFQPFFNLCGLLLVLSLVLFLLPKLGQLFFRIRHKIRLRQAVQRVIGLLAQFLPRLANVDLCRLAQYRIILVLAQRRILLHFLPDILRPQ